MDDLGAKSTESGDTESKAVASGGKEPTKIPFKFFDMHGDMNLLIFEPYIEDEHVIPKTGFNIVSFNAHIDDLVPNDMQLRLLVTPPSEEPHLFDNFGLENWIKNISEKGYVKNVVWIKPPWTKGVLDGSRILQVPDPQSNATHEVSLDMKTLCRSVFENVDEDYEGFKNIFSKMSEDPYILDFELSFFSCDNSFTEKYELCPTYYQLFKELFEISPLDSMDPEHIKTAYNERKEKLEEIDKIMKHLQKNRCMPVAADNPTPIYKKISKIREELLKYYEDKDIDWDYVYAAGLVCNEYELPIHYSKRDDIEKMVNNCVSQVVDLLSSPPIFITVAIMYDYMRFIPEKDLDFIIELIQNLFKSKYKNLDQPEFIGY